MKIRFGMADPVRIQCPLLTRKQTSELNKNRKFVD